jgi:cell division protein FtsI/penicillin-binding protein 2
MAAKLGRLLGADRLHACVEDFGFCEKTGIGLPGEAGPIVGPRTVWSPHTVISVPFGQELAVTPLQLATGYAALVNGGLRVRPRLIRRLEDLEGRPLRQMDASPPVRVISEATSAWVRRTLARVVEEGTGRRARVGGLRVGGKTGTSEKYERDERTGRMVVSRTKRVATFVAFAPADRPRLVCLVQWDEPKGNRYGGVAAAPVVGRILERAHDETTLLTGP